MNAAVTDHAVDRLRAIDQAWDLTKLVTLLPRSVQLVRSKKGGLVTVRNGQMRAVIATVPEEPGKMVVDNVYRAGEEEAEGDELRAAVVQGEDIADAA